MGVTETEQKDLIQELKGNKKNLNCLLKEITGRSLPKKKKNPSNT